MTSPFQPSFVSTNPSERQRNKSTQLLEPSNKPAKAIMMLGMSRVGANRGTQLEHQRTAILPLLRRREAERSERRRELVSLQTSGNSRGGLSENRSGDL